MDALQDNREKTIRTSDLLGKKVYFRKAGKDGAPFLKKVGKIRSFPIHPKKAKVIGVLIKRPDLAWMFHRGDVLVSTDGLESVDGNLVYSEGGGKFGHEAEKALSKNYGITLDECLLWLGLPVLTESGEAVGFVKDMEFAPSSGNIVSIEIGKGPTSDTLLGSVRMPATVIRGFKRGKGTRLSDSPMPDDGGNDGDAFGALVVTDEALELEASGGVAEKAGRTAAVVADKTRKTYRKTMKRTEGIRRGAGEKAKKAASAASDAAEKGAFVTGRQIARASGMFSEFKDEFLKAMDDDAEDAQK